jgi:predicted O-methyltransferase YrrM
MPESGSPAVETYLAKDYETVVGMSSRFAAAVVTRLMAIQQSLGVSGSVVEIGAFEGRFLIALALALETDQVAVGIDLFEWPNQEVLDRFKANGRRCGLPKGRMLPLKADSGALTEARVRDAAGYRPIRLVHVDGEHSRAALARDLQLSKALIADGGLIVLDDMLHPGYPTLMVTVQDFLESNPEIVPLCVIDRMSIVGATKFVLCQREWFKRYEEIMLEAFKANIWPLGADFEPHWCLVLSLDTRLAAIV